MEARRRRIFVATAVSVGLAFALATGAARFAPVTAASAADGVMAPVGVVSDSGHAVRAAVVPARVEAARSEGDRSTLLLLVAVLVAGGLGVASRRRWRLADVTAARLAGPDRHTTRDRGPPGAPFLF